MTGGTPDVEQHVETSPNARYIRYSYVLGKGAYKTVYKAFDTEEALEVAWNKLHVDRLSEHDLEKVSNEVSLLRQVNHKNIIHFYDTWRGQDANGNQTINFITEQMMSGTLKEYLRKAKAIKLKVIRRWCSNILEAIAYLHSQDPPIMHRDLKCDNIFINGHVGEVKIGDLGLSGVKEREKADSVIGTPEFMAPELYEESYTEKVDIYAFGMCLLEIVSMEYPYSECNNMAQIFKKVFSGEKPRAFDTLIDGDVKDVIAACLQREARRPSAMDLLKHPLFSEWEKDDGVKSNLSLVKGATENVPADKNTEQSSRSMPIGTELIDWSDPLKRNVLVSMLEGEGAKDNQEVSVVAAKENGGFYIGLEIPIRDAIKRVEFTFDPFEDSSQHIAHEMVAEFDLGTEQLSVIQHEIDRQVKIAKEQREAASRNATPQPATKHAEPTSSSQSMSSRAEPKSTSLPPSAVPSSGTSHTEQSSIPVQQPVTHGVHEAVSTSTSDHISQRHVPERTEHQQELTPQQQVQPQVQEVAQNIVQQDHAPQEQPIAPKMPVQQQAPELAKPVPEAQATQHLATEQLIQQAVVTHPVQVPPPATVESEPQQVQTFVQESITAPLPKRDDESSAKPQAPSYPQQVDANVIMPESHEPLPVSAQAPAQLMESQSLQHTEQHLETRTHHPVPQSTMHPSLLPEGTLQAATGDMGGVQTTPQVVGDMGFHQQQLDVAPEASKLRPSPSFGEDAATQTDGDSINHNGLPTQEHVSITSASSSTAVPQTPNDASYIHEAHRGKHQQEVLEAQLEHHVHEENHQALPHTSSFVSSQAQSSTSVETSSGVISPILPQEAHISTPFPQDPARTVLEETIPPVTHEARTPKTQESGVTKEHVRTEEAYVSAGSALATNIGNDARVIPDGRSVTSGSSAEHTAYHGREEVMHRANSFPQQRMMSSEAHGADRSLGSASNTANHFPQSVSDDVLPASSRVTVINLPARPPSTPITPASPNRDASDEQYQTSPPTVRTMLQGAGVEPMSQIYSVAVQGENYVNSQPRSRDFGEDRTNLNVNSRPRPKSGSRPQIVVVSSEPSGGSGESSRWGGVDRPAKILSECMVPEMVPSTYSAASDFSNRRLGSPERATAVTVTGTQIGDYRSEQSSSQQPSPPGADQLRTNSWMSLQSDETSGSTSFRDPASSGTSGKGVLTGKQDQEWYTLNLKLMDSCARGIYEEVATKLSQGASASFADYDKRTPLHLAATEGHVSVCVLLLESGADVNAKDRWGQTPLSNANEGKSAEVKELLTANGAVDEGARSVEVLSMELMQQTARGDLEAVRQKIVAGALVTFQDYDHRSPLHLACSEGHAAIAEVLLVNGASYSTKDRKGRSPVDDAVTNGHLGVLRVLKQYGASVPQHLFEAEPDLLNQKGMDLLEHAARGSVQSISECLTQGASAKYSDYDSRTAMHVACSEGRLEVVQKLLQAGADIHAPDRWGSTPLDEAGKAGFSEIVEEISRWDAKRTQRQAASVSFDHSAMMNGHVGTLHPGKDTGGAHFDHLSHGIATSVSMGAIPHIAVSADDFVAEYPSSSARDPSSAGNSTSFSLPLTPFEATEDTSQIGNRTSEEILLEEAYNARKRQLEEDHRRAVEEMLRKKTLEAMRSAHVSSDSMPPRSSTSQIPMASRIQVIPPDGTRFLSTRAVSEPTDFGTIANGSVVRMEPRHSGGTSRVSAGTTTETLPSTRIARATYVMNEDISVGVGSEISGENPAIRNLVDGLIDAAVRSNS